MEKKKHFNLADIPMKNNKTLIKDTAKLIKWCEQV